jgi:hypothetical protein
MYHKISIIFPFSVLLYRNIILLSLLVLLENFMASLLRMNRKLLVSVLMEYSPAFANARAPVTTGVSTNLLFILCFSNR